MTSLLMEEHELYHIYAYLALCCCVLACVAQVMCLHYHHMLSYHHLHQIHQTRLHQKKKNHLRHYHRHRHHHHHHLSKNADGQQSSLISIEIIVVL
jgi:hypothetical protein